MSLQEDLLRILNDNQGGVSDNALRTHFSSKYQDLVPVINDLLQGNRLQLFMQGDILFYRIVQEEVAAKFDGLGYLLI
jgi:hypothetical protein